jgi:hypothetical protein
MYPFPPQGRSTRVRAHIGYRRVHAREHVRDHAKVRERFRSRRRRADGIPRREEPAGLGRQHKSCMHLTANQRAINALRFRIEEFINLLMYYMFDALVVKNRRL